MIKKTLENTFKKLFEAVNLLRYEKVLEENVYIFSTNKRNKATRQQGKAKQKKGNGTTLKCSVLIVIF
jgi:hypothetical protein